MIKAGEEAKGLEGRGGGEVGEEKNELEKERSSRGVA